MCSELNISRTPVREALLELQQEGYIAFMRGKGIQVIPVTRKRAQDIVEARYYLELSGARLAAQRRTAAQIEALEQLLLEQESRCHDRAVRASYQLDRKFHHEIFLASGNTWMQEEIEKLRDHFLRIETQSAFDSPEQAEHVILEHRGILTAICICTASRSPAARLAARRKSSPRARTTSSGWKSSASRTTSRPASRNPCPAKKFTAGSTGNVKI